MLSIANIIRMYIYDHLNVDRQKDLYYDTGLIHTREIGGLIGYYQWWESKVFTGDPLVDGRLYCDNNGIVRHGDWVSIGSFSGEHLRDIQLNCMPRYISTMYLPPSTKNN